MFKAGIFICHCGSNIAGTVDIARVRETVKNDACVACCMDYPYMCSAAGQKLVQDAIAEYQLDGIVVCSCSPRMHENTFRAAAKLAGLNPYMVEIANLREQCAWVHHDREEATDKAIVLVRTALAKLLLDAPLKGGETPVTKRALVIGGGIAGITAALEIADAGYQVDLVEKESSIGGRMAQLDKTFPTLDCSACILTPKMVEVSRHPNIELLTLSEVEAVKGYVGSFEVTIRRKARYVDLMKCTGCGECAAKCPSRKGLNAFNLGMNTRGAVYIPFAQAIPAAAVIDPQNCLRLSSGKCGLCQKVCKAGAINYADADTLETRAYGAIVCATGFRLMDVRAIGEYGYGRVPNVITSLELERILNAAGPTNGEFVRPSDGKHPKEIVFIQCVGSRCDHASARGKTYCSKVCCMYTAKQSMLLREKYPDTHVRVFYIDVRTPGKGFDEFWRRAVEQYGVEYIKGQVGRIYEEDGKCVVCGSDLLSQTQLTVKADLVVLAAAVEPEPSARQLATMLTASMDNDGFFTEAHPKLRPVESPTSGIFLCGMAQGPKDIPETVSQAGAAAAKVIGLLAKASLATEPTVAGSDAARCSGCSRCASVCAYHAISFEEREVRTRFFRGKRRVAVVNSALCRGCGACTVTCPSGAMDLSGFTNEQLRAEVDAICR